MIIKTIITTFHHNYSYKEMFIWKKMISWLEKNKIIPRIITALLFILIFYISSIKSFPSVGVTISTGSIIYHISIFFILALFLFISVLERKWNWKKILLSLLIVGIYAALDELHQFFVPGRFCSFNDFLLDFTGIIFASLLYFVMIAKKKL